MLGYTERDPEFYHEHDLMDMRHAKKDFIKKMQFEEAKAVEKAIDIRLKEMNQFSLQAIVDDAIRQINEAKMVWDDSIEKIMQNYERCINEARDKINLSYQQLQDEQMRKLINLERKRVVRALKCKDRPVKDYLYLQNAALKCAQVGDLDEAIYLRDESVHAYEKEILMRREEVEKLFDVKRQTLYQGFEVELNTLAGKLKAQLIELERQKNVQLRERERAFCVDLYDIQQAHIPLSDCKENTEVLVGAIRRHILNITNRTDFLPDTIVPKYSDNKIISNIGSLRSTLKSHLSSRAPSLGR